MDLWIAVTHVRWFSYHKSVFECRDHKLEQWGFNFKIESQTNKKWVIISIIPHFHEIGHVRGK